MAEYAIVVSNETDGAEKSPLASTQAGEVQTATGKGKKDKGDPRAKAIYGGLLAYNHYVKPFISQVINYGVSTVSLRTGSQELQQRISFAKEMGESAINLGTSILAGFAVGNAAGAAIGALLSISTTIMGYANKQQTINTENNLEQISTRMLGQRAGGFPPGYSGSREVGR